jgi:IclR family transcriptional regulator, blcABC operon repressor
MTNRSAAEKKNVTPERSKVEKKTVTDIISGKAQDVATPEQKSATPAVNRAARILDLLAESDTPLGLADLSRAIDAPKSSLHGLCATLTQLRLISRSDNGLMSIGPHVMFWANAFLARANIAQEFSTVCRESNIMADETITLSVLDGAHVVYIACHNGSRPLGIQFLIGMRLPAQFTATGKAMLATMSDDEVEDRLCGSWPIKMTPSSAPSMSALKRELNQTRERKFSIDDGQIREGMHCFGAPVFDANNSLAGGIAVSLLSHDLSPKTIQQAGDAMRTIANRLSERLGSSQRI